MEHEPSRTSDAGPPAAARLAAALVLAGVLLAFAGSIADGPWDREQAPPPYVWRDVAVVTVLCAVPLAAALAASLRRRAAAGLVGLAVLSLGAGALPLLGGGWSAVFTDPALGAVARAVPALGLAAAAALAVAVLTNPRPGRPGSSGSTTPAAGRGYAALAALGAVILLLVPSVYVGARCRHDLGRLGELLEQSRFGEAQTLARGLLALGAEGEWNGHPLPEVAAEIDRVVRALESDVAAPLPALATPGERLDRARQLAMLGRTEEALDVLGSVRAPAAAPAADNLRGTIHETRGEWEPALAAYRRAREGWESRPPSPERDAELLRATTGLAYCRRKLGQYAEAEEAYRQVLALAPTADSHFLLAQFYEDTQQSAKAREHARRAMAMAPDRYGREGEKLINKLTVLHFGCLGVFNAESDRSRTSLVPAGGDGVP